MMKQLLNTILTLSILLPLGALGQTFSQRTNGSFTPVDPYLSVPKAIYIPRSCDTTTALNGGKDTVGAMVWDTCNHNLWVRDTAVGGHTWRNIATFANGMWAAHNSIRCIAGDSIYFFGDSYTAGSGASTSAYRWSTLFANRAGAVEVNHGLPGGTLMLQPPADYQGVQAMTERLSQIPTKAFNKRLLIFAFGLNDMGQTAAAYTAAHFREAYDTVMLNCITKGWKPNEILIIPPYWIGQAGYNVYATLTGNPAPTYQRHLSFVRTAQDVASKWGTLYFDMYNDQLRNDTTLISVDNIHPTDAGYAFIGWNVAKYIGASENIYLGSAAALATSTPKVVNRGGSYGNTPFDLTQLKDVLYDDGLLTNRFGSGVYNQVYLFHAGGPTTKFFWKINNTGPHMTLGTSGLLLGQNTSSAGSSTPNFLSLGGTYNTVAGDTINMKFRIYDVTSNAQAGVNISSQNSGLTGHLEFISGYNVSNDIIIGPRLMSRMNTDGSYYIYTLDTDNTPPATTGTTKVTISDANGILSQGPSTSVLPNISTGTTAPGSTPTKVGDIYIDITNKKLYFAAGTSSSADWIIAN